MYGYFGRSLDIFYSIILPQDKLNTIFSNVNIQVNRTVTLSDDLTLLVCEDIFDITKTNAHYNKKVLATTAVGYGCKCCNKLCETYYVTLFIE